MGGRSAHRRDEPRFSAGARVVELRQVTRAGCVTLCIASVPDTWPSLATTGERSYHHWQSDRAPLHLTGCASRLNGSRWEATGQQERMDYDTLTVAYRQRQVDRLLRALQRLGEIETAPGRVVPEAEDLVIGAGRRLDVAVMFVDISGFSSWPAETLAEQKEVLAVLSLFFTEIVRIAEDYGGTVEKNTGDGLMAYFEDSTADEGSKRAVACALTMLNTNVSLIAPLLATANIAPIQFRVAIDHGPATIGRLGAARRFNAIVAVGTVANVASKMLSFAQAW